MRFSLRLYVLLYSLLMAATFEPAHAKQKIAFLAGFTSSSPNIALTDINFEKGLKTFLSLNPDAESKLDIEKFDNQGDASNTAFEIQRITAKGIRFVIGISKSNQALVAAPLSDELKFLFITPFATDSKITRGHRLAFRTCFSNDYQAEVLAHFATKELKAKKILVLINADSPYSVGLGATFAKTIGKEATLNEIRYLAEPLDLEPLKKAVQTYNPDTVFIPDYVSPSVTIVKALYLINPSLQFLGGDGWGGREVLDPALIPIPNLKAFYSTAWSKEIQTPENAKFIQAFTKLYGQAPVSVGPAVMYDAMSVFWQAYKKAKGTKTPDSLRRSLLENKFQTITGKISFPNPSDTTPEKPVVLVRVGAGKHEFYKLY
jgi:branched-chain amino acid transport system substrate-binding protein